MRIACPRCDRLVDGEDLNIGADVAFCKSCNEAFSVSECLHAAGRTARSVPVERDRPVDLQLPPRGAWFERTFDGFRVGGTTRSAQAFFLVPFMVIWSGASLGGIYGSQISSGEFEPMLSLFGIPFVLGSVIFWTLALMAICGRVEVSVRQGREGVVFVGIGAMGWKRRFDWRDISSVAETPYGRGQTAIALEGRTRVTFGSGLNDKRRYFVVEALRRMLAESARRGY